MYEEDDFIIDVQGLHKYYHGVHVLRDIDLKVRPGQLVSIIGRSGCGKTTLLRTLNCLEILDQGTIRIAGVTLSRRKRNAQNRKKRSNIFGKKRKGTYDLANERAFDEDFQIKMHTLRQRVGMLFQSLNLFPHLTVLENVSKAPLIVKKESEDQATLRAIQILEKVGMSDFIERYPSQLSGGQAQRVAIARALAMSPQVMLYDEPTSALDPELIEEVLQVMRNLHSEGMTQVVVTHAMSFARSASDLVIYMENGEIIEMAPPEELFNNPKDERTRQYLSIVRD